MGENGMSPSDVRAVVDASNGGYAYPPYMGGYGGGFGGFGNGDWSWILLLILLTGGYGFGGGFGGFGGFGMGMDFMYPWLANGQQEIISIQIGMIQMILIGRYQLQIQFYMLFVKLPLFLLAFLLD